MKRLLIAALLLIGASLSAYAQSQRNPCYTTNNINCIPVGTGNGTGNGPLPVSIISPNTITISPSGLQNINIQQVGGTNNGTSVPVTIISPSTLVISPNTTTLGVINGANRYNTIAASATNQALTGGGGGAIGDYLSHCVIFPATISPGVLTILDNATPVFSFAGGVTTNLNTLIPFTVPVGALSVSGAWKVTTGASISATCVGKFN